MFRWRNSSLLIFLVMKLLLMAILCGAYPLFRTYDCLMNLWLLGVAIFFVFWIACMCAFEASCLVL